MGKEKLTTKQAIGRYKVKHGDRYDYSTVDYKGAQKFVTVICRLHGEFSITHSNMLNSQGCPTCGKTREHNWTFCDRHTEKHLITRGCSLCRKEAAIAVSWANYLVKAQEKYGATYDYSRANFRTFNGNITVTCNTCGTDSTMTARNHLIGAGGCKVCQIGGFKKTKPGRVYLLGADGVFKIGITNRTVKTRARQLSTASGVDFKILAETRFEDGSKCAEVEKGLLKQVRDMYPVAELGSKFYGYSECFKADFPPLTTFLAACQAET